MYVRELHSFELTAKKAVALQRELAPGIVRTGGLPRRLRRVAGVDCAPAPDGRLVAAAVLCSGTAWGVEATAVAKGMPGMPYVPGLLSFREAPLVLAALRELEGAPDAILVDGQGLAHPRRLGLACHLGLHLDVPVIGVAKSLFVGVHEPVGPERGERSPLKHGGTTIGTVVRTRTRVKPVYVSVGNRVGLRSAVRAVLETCTRYRLPEPVRQADLLSKRTARGL